MAVTHSWKLFSWVDCCTVQGGGMISRSQDPKHSTRSGGRHNLGRKQRGSNWLNIWANARPTNPKPRRPGKATTKGEMEKHEEAKERRD